MIFAACLIAALVSQIIAPTDLSAATGLLNIQADINKVANQEQTTRTLFELDPDDPNPTLFAMAKDASKTDLSSFGGPIEVEGAKVSDSGLRITDLVLGNGPEATAGQKVSVHYVGTLADGTEFDSSYGRGPFTFPLGAGRVIKGWDEGVAGMKVGGKRKLVIPPELGYGSKGAGKVIPPNAILNFEVELLEIN